MYNYIQCQYSFRVMHHTSTDRKIYHAKLSSISLAIHTRYEINIATTEDSLTYEIMVCPINMSDLNVVVKSFN